MTTIARWGLRAALLIVPACVFAQTASEPALKAAFVQNFVKFTDWPASTLPAAASLVICVADPDVAAELDGTTANRLIGQHPLSVRRLKVDENPRGCAVLYLPKTSARRVAEVATAARDGGILTVSDTDGFAEAGGMVGLFIDGDRMRFAINVSATERAGLRLSAKLLSLARLVKD